MTTFIVKVKNSTINKKYQVTAAGWYDAFCEAVDTYGHFSQVSVKPL